MMNKKGQGISINMIVIIIIALLVLLVIAIIFLGGTGTMADRIKNFFTGTTSAYNLANSQQFCNNYCDLAQDMPNPQYSAYCTSAFDIDIGGDGTIDYVNTRCKDNPIGISCSGVTCTYTGTECGTKGAPVTTCKSAVAGCGDGEKDFGPQDCDSGETCCGKPKSSGSSSGDGE